MSKLSIDRWGPATWHALHAITIGFPTHPSTAERRRYVEFFGAVGMVLPCGQCRDHFQRQVAQHPVDARSRASLVRWLFTLHNEVNHRSGKPTFEYDEFIDQYVSRDSAMAVELREEPTDATELASGLTLAVDVPLAAAAVVAMTVIAVVLYKHHAQPPSSL